MPTTSTEYQSGGTPSYMSFRGRSILSMRRNQVVSMEHGQEHELHELDLFQTHVADRLLSLLPISSSDKDGEQQQQQHLLSFSFLGKLLDAFLCCEEEFQALLLLLLDRNPALLSKPPLDRLVSDLLDRTVKALDICNAVSHALDSLHHWQRHADIAASALHHRSLHRARKALTKLLASTLPDPADGKAERAWSFSRRSNSVITECHPSRSLSWSVSRNWSAAKQVQAMSASLATPRGGEAGIAVAVYTMSSMLLFSMWALVAAFPCQDRGGSAAIPVAPPRQVRWTGPMVVLQERIAEEWRRREKRGSAVGLLAELQGVERCGRVVMEAMDGDRAEEEAVAMAGEMAEACRRLEEGVGPFERQVREVFHRIVRSRTEVLHCLDQRSTGSTLL